MKVLLDPILARHSWYGSEQTHARHGVHSALKIASPCKSICGAGVCATTTNQLMLSRVAASLRFGFVDILKGTSPMLRDLKDLENFKICATDGNIGCVKDCYFADDAWVVRYFVVEAGTWLSSRKVLISLISVHHPDWPERTLRVSITREQVKNSPDMDTDKPVSRQNEAQYLEYYGYPAYWGGNGMWGESLYPYALVPGYAGYGLDRAEHDRERQAYWRDERLRHLNDDPHLRSCNAVTGYHIDAADGKIGHVSGFLVDDETWAILYLIIDTSNWWVGHKVLIAPSWITGVHWSDRTISVDVTRDLIKQAPTYDSSAELSRVQELDLYRHYGRLGYWTGSTVLESEI